jgi:hypothetical protein
VGGLGFVVCVVCFLYGFLFVGMVFMGGWVCGFFVSGGSLWSLGDSCKPNSLAVCRRCGSGAVQCFRCGSFAFWLLYIREGGGTVDRPPSAFMNQIFL